MQCIDHGYGFYAVMVSSKDKCGVETDDCRFIYDTLFGSHSAAPRCPRIEFRRRRRKTKVTKCS